ncbi:MAG TPA: asparagine synthetase B family protein, partial [Chloroflexota bacterium]|nr:asparagine synthetase B family protein [Chloroflexota bacterium]
MIDASVTDAPYLSLRLRPDGQVHVRGAATCQLGQSLDYGHESPDGVFAWWRWDGSALRAANDRYGMQPLFYARDGEGIALSSSLPRLLLEGAPADLDEAALAVFLRTGYFVGEDTAFRAIRALPPNARLEWSGGRLHVSGGLPLPPRQTMTRDEAIDAYIPLFREAVRRRLPAEGPGEPELVMPLSGGRDSRHILLELLLLGCRPAFCLTVRHHLPRVDQDA